MQIIYALMKGWERMPGMQDVANAAGVSIATVSRVINNVGNVLPETASKVLQAMEALQYKPSFAVHSQRNARNKVILAIFPEFINPFWGDILEGMDATARSSGCTLITCASHSDVHQELRGLNMLKEKQVDGVILLSSVLSEDELDEWNRQYPILLCCEYEENTHLSYVSVNYKDAAYQGITYLIRMGHKRIALISSASRSNSILQKEAGYKQALADCGISFDPALLVNGSYQYESGYEKGLALMQIVDPPTAIMTISDTAAAGCLCAIYESGKRCPQDVAILGFDNMILSRMLYPPLTTVGIQKRRMGGTAVKMLLDRIGGDTTHRCLLLPHEIVVRQSV